MLIHYGYFCTAHMQLITSFPTHHPQKKSGLQAAVLFSMFFYKVVEEATFTSHRVQILDIVQVTPEVDHLLSS